MNANLQQLVIPTETQQTQGNNNPSLIKPDFSGLWSVSWIGGKYNPKYKPSTLSSLLSIISMSIVAVSWIWGFLSPLIILTLVYYKYYTTSIIMISILAYPYIVEIKPRAAVCRFYVKYGCSYFEGGASMIYEVPPNDLSLPLGQRKPTMNSYHPHGILTIGFFHNSGIRLQSVSDQSMEQRQATCGDIYGKDKLAKDCTLKETKIPYLGLADKKLLSAPLFNHFCVKWTGCIEESSGRHLTKLMQNNNSIGILPGGFYEAALFEYGKDFVYLKEKKGFIKYALRFGYQIVPAYTFGECKTYRNLLRYLSSKYEIVEKIIKWLSKKKMPAVMFFGGYPWFNPILPYSKGVGIHTIHGPAIEIPKITNPTQDDINKYHDLYCEKLKELFDRNKFRFGMNNVQLVFM